MASGSSSQVATPKAATGLTRAFAKASERNMKIITKQLENNFELQGIVQNTIED